MARKWNSWIELVGLVIVLVAKISPAQADSSEDCMNDKKCHQHYVDGTTLFKTGRFVQAIQEFKSAYRIRSAPLLLLNIGRAYFKDKNSKEALKYYYLYRQMDQQDLPQIENKLKEYVAQAEAELAKVAVPKAKARLYSYVDVSFSLIPAGRIFSFDDGRGPDFAASVSLGFRLDITGHPLANRNIRLVDGFGIGATVDLPYWPPSKVCTKADDGSCLSFKSGLETNELVFEGGIRWSWNIMQQLRQPSLLFLLQYGVHQFAVRNDYGLPDVRYQYVDLGLGGRIPLLVTDGRYIGMILDFHYHVLIGGDYGFRLSITPVEWKVWHGITLRVQGYYERFKMSFGGREATDQFFGALLGGGYQY